MESIDRVKRENAISMLIPLVVEDIVDESGRDADAVMTEFLSSETGQLLYDGDSDLWQSGPAYIAELFREELKNRGVIK